MFTELNNLRRQKIFRQNNQACTKSVGFSVDLDGAFVQLQQAKKFHLSWNFNVVLSKRFHMCNKLKVFFPEFEKRLKNWTFTIRKLRERRLRCAKPWRSKKKFDNLNFLKFKYKVQGFSIFIYRKALVEHCVKFACRNLKEFGCHNQMNWITPKVIDRTPSLAFSSLFRWKTLNFSKLRVLWQHIYTFTAFENNLLNYHFKRPLTLGTVVNWKINGDFDECTLYITVCVGALKFISGWL